MCYTKRHICEFLRRISGTKYCSNLLLPFNSLPNDTILDWIQSRVFADDKINVSQIKISFCDRIENIVGTGQNGDYRHCLKKKQFKSPLLQD